MNKRGGLGKMLKKIYACVLLLTMGFITVPVNAAENNVSMNSVEQESESQLVNYDDAGEALFPEGEGDVEVTGEAGVGTMISNAVTISFGQDYYKLWDRSNYYLNHFVKIVVPKNGIITFTSNKPHDSKGEIGKINIFVYNSRNELVGGRGTFQSDKNSSSIYTYSIGLEAGTYYMNITPGFAVQSGSILIAYDLTFTESDTCELESNETAACATPMQLNTLYTGFFGTDGVINTERADYYKVDLVAGQTYHIVLPDYNRYSATSTIIWLRSGGSASPISVYLKTNGKINDNGQLYLEYIPKNTGTAYLSYENYLGEQYKYTIGICNAGASVTDYNALKSFVTRMYNICLDREPDSSGLNTWVESLANKSKTGAEVAYGFVFSQEFQNKNLCNEDYVKALYRAFLGREYDVAGLASWINDLESGKTREEVFNGFSQSNEFKGLCSSYGIELGSPISIPQYGTVPTGKCCVCGRESGVTEFVNRMYNVCLDRNSDAEGLNTWTTCLWNHSKSGAEVAYGFIFSPEFQNRNMSNEDFVEYMYKAFFGRGSDPEGKSTWVGVLQSGQSREDVFRGFVGSQEFSSLCNKYGIKRD